MDEQAFVYLWRWTAVALGTGIAAGGMTAIFLGVGLPHSVSPALAMGLVFVPMILAIRRMNRRARQTVS